MPAKSEKIEMDELWTFVGEKKKKVYIVTAVDRETHAIVGWAVCAERSVEILQTVIDDAPLGGRLLHRFIFDVSGFELLGQSSDAQR